MNHCILITTVKNRADHFLKTFPLSTSQYGISYEISLVDFYSNDGFYDHLKKQISFRKEAFSPFLKKINYIKLLKDLKFNPRKAKNLGSSYHKNKTGQPKNILAFNDADVLLGMTYLEFWSNKIRAKESFLATRTQETRASLPRRLATEINYGNLMAHSEDFFAINGFDENVGHYGGDDDDLYHRLKLYGLKEINPYSPLDARQFSILHGDDLRVSQLEDPRRVEKEKAFDKIFKNQDFLAKDSNFLNLPYSMKISTLETLYDKEISKS
tara:strand:- start:2599 stop:3405 length:807 start_codon:yes stop_codon:yes gene_type:complete